MMDLSRSLIETYGGQAPRYTSYPPANHFYNEPALGPALRQFFADPRHLRLPYSLYLHFPYCTELCFFCGCNMEITHSGDKVQQYIDCLMAEITLWSRLMGGRIPVVEIHFGGGSPSDIPMAQMERIMAELRGRFDVKEDARISIEVDPRNVASASQAQRWVNLGFNRVSLGVQDFEPAVQKAVNRLQPERQTFQAHQWFKQLGVGSINIDLIYGLPLQTADSFARTLRKVLALNPDRIALFQFAYLPKLKKHHGMIHNAQLPAAELRLQLFDMALQTLRANGYVYLGMDHFAKPGDPLSKAAQAKRMGRNFQGYHEGVSQHLIGLGMSSIGVLDHIYFQNAKNVAQYQAAVQTGTLPLERGFIMSPDDRARRFVIERLMCDFSLDFHAVGRYCDLNFLEYFQVELRDLAPMHHDGLISLNASGLAVTDQGKHFIRFIAKVFDAYARAGKLSAHHMTAA